MNLLSQKKGIEKKDCPLLRNKDKRDSNANVAHYSNENFDFTLTSSSFVWIQLAPFIYV